MTIGMAAASHGNNTAPRTARKASISYRSNGNIVTSSPSGPSLERTKLDCTTRSRKPANEIDGLRDEIVPFDSPTTRISTNGQEPDRETRVVSEHSKEISSEPIHGITDSVTGSESQTLSNRCGVREENEEIVTPHDIP
ncbi:unnamed protein product [Mycena citricolor]|uniref:Uncharacterized protein n=1 Tax=Mycena citricolor TaxID=2018698 RepID=A0AAD2H6T4_9AGAR|nr:unnamed protein product [Mycena citricolor]